MDILSNEENQHVISWLPHGNGFVIHKKKTFANEVLPKYFKASKFTSFTRKLNRWGFSRVPRGPETGSYYHKVSCAMRVSQFWLPFDDAFSDLRVLCYVLLL